jgi:hypothetical protein
VIVAVVGGHLTASSPLPRGSTGGGRLAVPLPPFGLRGLGYDRAQW